MTYEDSLDDIAKQLELGALGEWQCSPDGLPHHILPSSIVSPSKVPSSIFSPFTEMSFIEQDNPEICLEDTIIGSTFLSGDELMLEDPLGIQSPFATAPPCDDNGSIDLTETCGENLGQQNTETICAPIPSEPATRSLAERAAPIPSEPATQSLAERAAPIPREPPTGSLAERAAPIPREPATRSLAERMLAALDRFKRWSLEGILAQVWIPVPYADSYILSTCQQPYLLDQMLSGYREVSRLFTFVPEPRPGCFLGLPGRVFASKIPEWTTNIVYYRRNEFLRVQHALDHEVRGTIALPVFEGDAPPGSSCCAVLELATVKDKPDFDVEMENVCHALADVNLRSTASPRLYPQGLTSNQTAALSEIYDVLRTVCFAHLLPLALTWIPCSYRQDCGVESLKVHGRGYLNSPNEKCVLCIEETACYVSDRDVKGFVHACGGCYLGAGQGIAGKALNSNRPFFHPDVRQFDISEYPLVHHARKFGLKAAVAIRLRSTYTGDNDYVIEFFLPAKIRGNSEQLLLNNLSSTMHRVCKSLRQVSDEEFHGRVNLQDLEMGGTAPVLSSRWSPEQFLFSRDLDLGDIIPINQNQSEPLASNLNFNVPNRQPMRGSIKPSRKKRCTTEKHVSLNVLQHYFPGSLKDAAKSIGVCPTTLKRICRMYGISRWPARKIKKVTRSLKKIRGVISSVEVIGGSAGSMIDLGNGVFLHYQNDAPPHDPAAQNVQFTTAAEMQCSNQVAGHTSSSMTGSCNGSGFGPLMNNSSSSPQSRDKKQKQKQKSGATRAESGPKLVAKATYKKDTVRFKVEAGGGCVELYEQVAKRFKLEMGRFQLKYLDDEEEWVLLETDSDLQECLEMLDCVGARYVKLLARDVRAAGGSSGDSNRFLEED